MADIQISAIHAGTVTLTNTKPYPFNDSEQTVMLEASVGNTDYAVVTELMSADGEVGDIIVTDKAVNGFKLAFSGSAHKAVIRYHIIIKADCNPLVPIRTRVPCERSGAVLTFGNGALTLDVREYERDDPVTVDIGADSSGTLIVGASYRYIAQVCIPARTYTIEAGPADDFGFPKLRKTAVPLDMEKMTLTLWTADEKADSEG